MKVQGYPLKMKLRRRSEFIRIFFKNLWYLSLPNNWNNFKTQLKQKPKLKLRSSDLKSPWS